MRVLTANNLCQSSNSSLVFNNLKIILLLNHTMLLTIHHLRNSGCLYFLLDENYLFILIFYSRH